MKVQELWGDVWANESTWSLTVAGRASGSSLRGEALGTHGFHGWEGVYHVAESPT